MTPRTLQNWEAAWRSAPRPPGRPPTPATERYSVLRRVARVVKRLGSVGWRTVKVLLPDAPRRLICYILRALAARRRRRRAARAKQVATHTTVHYVALQWCLDATQLGREADETAILGEVLVDAASRKVLSATVGGASTGKDIVALLRAAADQQGGLPLVLLTDNAPVYRSCVLENWLFDHGVLHLFSLPRTPQHNAQAERACGLLKQAADIGPAGQPIRSRADAELAVQRGLERLAARPRAVLGYATSDAAHESLDRWYTRVRRMEVVQDARRARQIALCDVEGERARRRAERQAILDTLVRHQLISRTRGGSMVPLVKREEES